MSRWKWFKRAPVMRIVWLLVMMFSFPFLLLEFLFSSQQQQRFSYSTLERKAKKQAELLDEEFEDVFHRQILAIVIPSFLRSDMKHFLPVVNFSEFLQRKLVVQHTLKTNSPLRNPPKVFIIGLPRTGSTFLHQLCALDSTARTVKAWEFRKPPEFNESKEAQDKKIQQVQTLLTGFYRLAPAIKKIHFIQSLDADECIQGMMDCAMADWFLWGAIDAPEAFDYYVQNDMRAIYANYARFLQTLPLTESQEFFWLKSPHHTFKLREIATVFPNCQFVWLHRREVENTVASCCSMNQAILDVTSPWYVHPHTLGKRTLSRLAQCTTKAMQDRTALQHDVQFVDVYYEELRARPVETMKTMYAQLGRTFSAELALKITEYVEKNDSATTAGTPAAVQHRYRLEDFGLSVSDVHQEFAPYQKAFFSL